MRVCIIGCGYSGLSAIRRCKDFGLDCVAFEINNQVGGLWVYTNKTTVDEFGVPIQTSLYESLRTNSPKQNLELPNFPFKTEEDTCYPHHWEVRRYLQEFVDHFNLLPYIKLCHYVTLVSRTKNKWKIEVKNLKKDCLETYYFDAVMICNGHTTQPYMPNLQGSESFPGLQLHSHDYRTKSIFANKKVLIIGFGPSGLEISHESTHVAAKTFVSQRHSNSGNYRSMIWKPSVKRIEKNIVTFEDESTEVIDVIVYCTGYLYYFPFLDESCRIRVEEGGRIIKPLYKHYINIEEPSMCFIGLFQYVIVSYLFDLQAQAFLKFLTKKIELPPKLAMYQWLDTEEERKRRLKIPSHRFYHLNVEIEEYFKDITAETKLPNIPPVLFQIFFLNEDTYNDSYYNHRYWYFEIEDDYNYKAYLKAVEDHSGRE